MGNALGEICRILLPIPEETFFGNEDSTIAVCTLSSISLLRGLSESGMLDDVCIAGRLLSENRGIDALIRSVNSSNVRILILCGREVRGHRAGASLMALYENGIDYDGRIVASPSPDPFLAVGRAEVERFRSRVTVVDRTGEIDPSKIGGLIDSLGPQ